MTCFSLYLEAIGRILDRVELDEDQGKEEDGDKEGEEEDDSLFIPLGWATPLPRQYYKGSDPEWLRFVQLSQDNKKRKSIQSALAWITRTELAKHPLSKQQIGEIDIFQGHYWLDFIFPNGPPLEYERAGIEISEDHVAWTKKAVSQTNHHRLKRLLWPSAAFSAIYHTSQHVFNNHVELVKKQFGKSTDLESTVAQQGGKHEERPRAQGKTQPIPEEDMPEEKLGEASRDAAKVPKTPDEHVDFKVARPGDLARSKENVQIPELSDMPQPKAFPAFQRALRKYWKPIKKEVPRGMVLITGLVEVSGTKSRAMMDVNAIWDPSIDRFVEVDAEIKYIQPRKQAPRGGP